MWREFCSKLMNYILISQLLAAGTFFGALTSICSTYSNKIFLANSPLIKKEKRLVIHKNVNVYFNKCICIFIYGYITYHLEKSATLSCTVYNILEFEIS